MLGVDQSNGTDKTVIAIAERKDDLFQMLCWWSVGTAKVDEAELKRLLQRMSYQQWCVGIEDEFDE